TVYGNQRVTAGGSIKRTKTRAISVKKKAQAD
ncbi:MAG: ribosome assembly RNA-binding protein YhbY, partial [Burkholderiales bacterium]|nr:ribosome assembly RNA-binding protein YhbY [Burkholderiales bacterium]